MGLRDFIFRRSSVSSFAQHNCDESLYFISEDEVKEYHPYYSVQEAEKRFEQICKSIVDSDRLEKWKKRGYFLIQSALEELYWDYCFNYVKYEDFIKEHGLDVKVRPGRYWKINGLLRVKSWFCSTGFRESVITYLRLPVFLLFLLTAFISGKHNRVWVDSALIKDFRFRKLQIPDSVFIILNRWSSVWGRKKAANNILDAINGIIHRKTCMWLLWVVAIKLLKPTKIIVKDNLFTNSSLLVAAKITKCKIVGVAHGAITKYHKGLFGSKELKGYLDLKYDNYYVWDDVFKKQLLAYGSIYNENEIAVSGWLQDFNYPQSKRYSNKYVLYPYEHFADYNNIADCLKYFINLGYIIVIKQRPDTMHYPTYKNNNSIVWVDDFKKEHIDNAICVLATTTTLAFDLCKTLLPVLMPCDNGILMFDDKQVENFIYFDFSELKDIGKLLKKYDEIKSWTTPDISDTFLAEFGPATPRC